MQGTDSSAAVCDHIARLDERVRAIAECINSQRARDSQNRDELWDVINDIRDSVHLLAVELALLKGQKQGISWVVALLLSTPGVASLAASAALFTSR